MKLLLAALLFSQLALGSGITGGGGGGSAWGGITGTLSSQTDLQTALDAKIAEVNCTDNTIVRVDGASGAIQCSGIVIADTDNVRFADGDKIEFASANSFIWSDSTYDAASLKYVVGAAGVHAFFSGAVNTLYMATNEFFIGTDMGTLTHNSGYWGARGNANNLRAPATMFVGTRYRAPVGAVDDGGYVFFTSTSDKTDTTGYGEGMYRPTTGQVALKAGAVNVLTGTATGTIINKSLNTVPKTVDVIADDQSVTTNDASYIKLTSDSATAADRTFVLADGNSEGQLLTLQWNEAVGTGAGELADSGNVNLSAAWAPDLQDTLSLRWDLAGSIWVETARVNN